jgi:predicted dehydrogenase
VQTHYALAKKALKAGKHVLIEKPFTHRVDQGHELIELAKEQGLILMVGHTFVYNPAVDAVREIIRSGQLGKIYYLNLIRANLGLLQPDINVMWDLAPHDISILSYILGRDAVYVSARGACYINTHRKLQEVVYVTLFYEDNIFANVRLSWLDPVKQRHLTLVGSAKMLVYDDIADAKVVIYDKGVEIPPYSVTEDEFKASYRHGGEIVYPYDWEEPLRRECAHFVECIRSGQTPRSSGEDGLKVVCVLETAQRSLLNRGVDLKIEYSLLGDPHAKQNRVR